MYAPETLPEKTLKDRDLKSYVEKANKAVLKKNEKSKMRKIRKKQKTLKTEEDRRTNFKEARKLAEKYY